MPIAPCCVTDHSASSSSTAIDPTRAATCSRRSSPWQQIELDDIRAGCLRHRGGGRVHHAAAPTYERLLHHLRPRILLGLTATPERTDGRSVLLVVRWSHRRRTALWDALERGLLSLSILRSARQHRPLPRSMVPPGYDVTALQNLYTGDQARVSLVVQASRTRFPTRRRCVHWVCVSVAHAEFMAREFSRRGLAR